MRGRPLLAVLGLSLASLLLFAAVASAHTFRADSRVTIRYNADEERFQGRVTSPRESCVKNRWVVIHRDTAGEDVAVGHVRSNENGFWKANEAVNPQGDFYARLPRRVRETGDHRHVCRRDVSDTISVGPPPPGSR